MWHTKRGMAHRKMVRHDHEPGDLIEFTCGLRPERVLTRGYRGLAGIYPKQSGSPRGSSPVRGGLEMAVGEVLPVARRRGSDTWACRWFTVSRRAHSPEKATHKHWPGQWHTAAPAVSPDSMKGAVLLVLYTMWAGNVFTPSKAQQEDHEMLYLGIDQHRKQLTVNLRNEAWR